MVKKNKGIYDNGVCFSFRFSLDDIKCNKDLNVIFNKVNKDISALKKLAKILLKKKLIVTKSKTKKISDGM